jgi:RNase P subunit RPR2
VPQTPQRLRGLLALDVAGLLWSLAGALAWVWLAWAHMRAPGASWVPGAAGIVGLAVGGYALRVGHLLWSRVEVSSTLTWLDLGGAITATPRLAEAGRSRTESLRVPELRLRARVVLLKSVFYAAAPHGPGSRVMLELKAERSAAEAWLPAVQELARKAQQPTSAAGQAAVRAKARDARPAEAEAAAPLAPKRPARFCQHCGTPLLAGARFCQHCGSTVTPE